MLSRGRFLLCGALGLVGASTVVVVASAGPEEAQPAPQEALKPLLDRLGQYALRFEEMERRGSFLLSGTMEELNGEGQVDGTRGLVLRVTAMKKARKTEILKYWENGEDKTEEAREKAKKPKKEDPKKKIRLPFSPAEQAKYVFEWVERDPKFPTRVRVAFRPHEATERSFAGSAWVDEPSGEILTLGFSPAKMPIFVRRIDFWMHFENITPLGRAPSSLRFEAQGGLLFLKKHFRGEAKLTEAKISGGS